MNPLKHKVTLPMIYTQQPKGCLSFGGRYCGFDIYPKDLRLTPRVNRSEKRQYPDRAVHISYLFGTKYKSSFGMCVYKLKIVV